MSYFRPIDQEISQFGETLTVTRSPIIELNSSYGTSLLRDQETVAGTGSITASNGELVLSTGATSSSSALLEAAEVGRYIPGYGAELGIGVRFATIPTGNQSATWGGRTPSGDDGFYFGYDSTGLFVARKRATVESKVYQSNWNIDKLDGSGASGYTLDLTKGVISQINFTWYGYGQIVFGFLGVINNQQTFIPAHEISNIDFAETSITSPNLKVYAEVKNNADASDATIYIGGRQYSIIGTYNPKFRFTGDFRGSVATSTTVKPLVSFRRKSDFQDRSIKLQGYDVATASADHYIEIRIGGSLTGASFVNPTDYIASETALEADKSATAITGGTVVWTGLIPSSIGSSSRVLSNQSVDLDVPNGDVVSLCVRTITGTGTAISEFKLREEW